MITAEHDFGWLNFHIKGIRETILAVGKMYYTNEEVTNDKVGEVAVKCCQRSGLRNSSAFIHTMKDAGETLARIVKDMASNTTEQDIDSPIVEFGAKTVTFSYPGDTPFMAVGISETAPVGQDIRDTFEPETKAQKRMMIAMNEEKIIELKNS